MGIEKRIHWLRYIGILMVGLLLGGCIELGPSWTDQNETRQVDYYKEQCDSDSTVLCFRIRETSSYSWDVVEEPFSGFDDYVWGQRHEVDVTVSFNDDGSTSSYTVTGLNSSTAIDDGEEAFSITLYTDTGIMVHNSDSEWQLGGEIAFDCGTSCDDLSSAVANQYVTQLEFVVVGDDSIELNNVICASAEEDFDSDCEGESQVSWRIGWFQSDCGLADAAMCLVYKVNTSDDYELLQLEDGITSFTPEWGSRYDIDVIKTVSDGGNITAVELEEDDSSPDAREGSTYDFKIILRGSDLETSDNSLVDIYDTSMELNCTGYCSTLNEHIEDDKWLLLDVYVDGDELQLTDITCDDSSLSNLRDCLEKN